MSELDNYIKAFIEEQRIIGKKYNVEEYYLAQFQRYCNSNYSGQHTLTKAIVTGWATKKEIESNSTFRFRVTPIRMLAMYLNRMGIAAYVLPSRYIQNGTKYIPHIFSDDEIHRFFREADSCKGDFQFPLKELALPLLFRLLYCCGLRVSEVQNLAVTDIDVVNGIIHIRSTKNGKDRDVPMTIDLKERCMQYLDAKRDSYESPSYLFSTIYSEKISYDAIYDNFRKFLRLAGISHKGRGKGPRIHDFRHTFAVHCLRSWVLQGKNMNSYYPVLSAYMGHTHFRYTEYYLRLTADMYPGIQEKLEIILDGVIPSLERVENYENY